MGEGKPAASPLLRRLEQAEHRWRKLFHPRRSSSSLSMDPVTLRPTSGQQDPTSTGGTKTKDQAGRAGEGTSSHATTPRIVGYWYLLSGTLVFTIVVVGGLTRLTESGLSIVEWNVIQGMRPPLTQAEWEAEFAKYQQFPEYQLTNHSITLQEFKFIFFMEWAHRMLGRFIGLSFVLPGAYFAYRGYLSRPLQVRSLAIGALIGVQGLLGWLMVKSGLSPHLVEERQVPRVSHYWLAAHLGTAFTIYSAMLLTALEVLRVPAPSSPVHSSTMMPGTTARLLRFSRLSKGLAGLVFLTAMSGALVAGLDAGLLYNEFPYMGTGLVPSDMWAYSTPGPVEGKGTETARPARMSWWRNLLENPSAVQFNHRLLAISTLTATTGLWAYARRLPLPARAGLAMHTVLGVACGQVALGIATLLYFVPTPVAAAHQAGSLTLLSAALWLVHTLRFVR